MSHFCLFCLLLLLPPSTSSPAVILLFVGENSWALRGDILPPGTPLPPHAHASFCPHPQQPHTHPAGTCGPVSQQALLLLLLQLLFFLPSLFGHLLPSVLTQLPTFPLQLCQPRLPSLLPSAVPAALLALPRSLATNPFHSLSDHGGSSDQLRLRSHPELRGDGVSRYGPSVRPLPFTSSSPPANNGQPVRQQWGRPSSEQGAQERWRRLYWFGWKQPAHKGNLNLNFILHFDNVIMWYLTSNGNASVYN